VKPSGVPSENHIRTWIRAIGQNHCIVESDASDAARARSCAWEAVFNPHLTFKRPRIDGEEKIVFVDDVPILEVYAGKCAADLGADLHLLDRGKLTKEAQPGTDLAHQRPAHDDLWKRRRRNRDGGVALTIRTD
jgi:hypothetical protein